MQSCSLSLPPGSSLKPGASILSQVYVHELSHNLYLAHAGSYNSAGTFDE